MPGGKAITEWGSSCRTFQSPKKRADAQGKPDPSLKLHSVCLASLLNLKLLLSSARAILQVFVGTNVRQHFHLCVPQVFLARLCQIQNSSCNSRDASSQLTSSTSCVNSWVMLGRDGHFLWHNSCHAVLVWLAGWNPIKIMTHTEFKNVHQFGEEAACCWHGLQKTVS